MQSNDALNGWHVELLPAEGDTDHAILNVYRFGVQVGAALLATDSTMVEGIRVEPVGG